MKNTTQEPQLMVVTTTQRIIRVIAFLISQFAILFITGMLYATLPGVGYYLSTFAVLEFLLAMGLFFVLGRTEEQAIYLLYYLFSKKVGDESKRILAKLEDVQQVQETTDTRLALIEGKLPKGKVIKVRNLVDGTSQSLPIAGNGTTTKAKADAPGAGGGPQ